jgi:hypothetical protein
MRLRLRRRLWAHATRLLRAEHAGLLPVRQWAEFLLMLSSQQNTTLWTAAAERRRAAHRSLSCPVQW